MRLPVAVGLAFTVWTALLAVVLTGRTGLDVYAVLLLIGLLVTRELVSASATRDLSARIGVFIFLGVLAFAYVVVTRVRDVLT